ncbi:TPA: hypothetical protein JRS25_003665 [Escherichia coli]|nr:hypothetical protein [Escherichia coli]HAY3976944.1 hypothetical protein [Escherichia coli]HBB9210914.1 hypothetical protein [Escherichia coli]
MENYGENQSKSRKKIALIDFLYKDMDLINSFYSQLFGGDLIDLTRSELSVDESTSDANCGIPIAKIASSSKVGIEKGIIEKISPYDDKVIKLLESFNLELDKISNHQPGSLIAIKGELIFRNFDAINHLIPFMGNSDLIPGFNDSVYPHAKGKQHKVTVGKLFEQLFKMIPYGLELEVNTTDGENALCIINESSLTISSNDILRAYGTNIPNIWSIIGILDKPNENPKSSSNNFKSGIDQATEAFSAMVLDNKSPIIRPIAIYRHLEV